MYFFFAISLLSPPLEKGVALLIFTNLNPLYLQMISAKFDWNWPSGSWEEGKMVKVYNNDNNNDDKQHTNYFQKRSLDLLAQVS